jgi:hypothetical protein
MGLAQPFVKATGLALATPWLLASAAAAPADACVGNAAQAPSVALEQGSIEGFRDDSCNSVFLGIPFADTTGGQNR